MIRLLVNVPPHAAGAEVDPAKLGDFAQQLLDDGQAERVKVEQSTDPVDAALFEVFEFEDQVDTAISRRHRIGVLIAGLDDDAKARVEAALATASRVRPALFGLDALPQSALALANEEGFSSVEVLIDRARMGQILLETSLPSGFENSKPGQIAEGIAALQADLQTAKGAFQLADDRALEFEKQTLDLKDQLTVVQADLEAARAGASNNPPPETGPSGSTDGAAAPSVEPAAPSQPAAKTEGGAAKAKKPGG